MSEWQPIETAPRDGRWFLVICDDIFLPVFGRYEQALKDTGTCLGIHFVIEAHGTQNTASPTHWMPLPAPPTTNEETP